MQCARHWLVVDLIRLEEQILYYGTVLFYLLGGGSTEKDGGADPGLRGNSQDQPARDSGR